jgi:hypothetical protein
MIRAGNFIVEVWEPYPCWVHITYGDKVIQISHSELSDIQYAVNKAIKVAKKKLGKRKDEV